MLFCWANTAASVLTFMKKIRKNTTSGLSRRQHFPEEERKLPWLPLLLDAYAIADTGVFIAIRDEEKRRKVKLACAKGCGNCCVHQKDLPFYPHELVGIYWFVSEKMVQPLRAVLRDRLDQHGAGSACPFLIDNSCSIHQVRPIGCRQFNVFRKPCVEGEDPYYTRRDDVLVPLPEYIDRAFAAVLPFYNIKENNDSAGAVRLVRSQIMNLQTYDWKKLVALLDQTETGEKG
jgi:Fe-S-cluster containining protein